MFDFKKLEILVAKIQSELAPNAEILHNQYLQGRLSNRKRQIDILVKDRIGQYDIQIVIDCKDYKKAADVKSVEEFNGLLEDVGAQKGVLVCPAGFSAAAKIRAEGLQIELYSPVDTEPHKWTVNPEIPVVCDFRAAWMSFGISMTSTGPFEVPYDFYAVNRITNADSEYQGTMLEASKERWKSGLFPVGAGLHERLPIFDDTPYMDNGHGTSVPVDLWVSIGVSQNLFFGMLPITKISGFKDEIKGGVITNAFETGFLDAEIVCREWQEFETIDSCPSKPVLVLQGLMGWETNHPPAFVVPDGGNGA